MTMRRRGRGEGSIFKRGDGVWVASVTIGYDSEGRRRRRYVYAKTKTQVLEKLQRLHYDTAAGILTESPRITIATFLARWLEDACRPSVRLSTFALYEMAVRRHINPHLGGVPLARLTPANVQGMLTAMERAGTSPALRHSVFRILHRALQQALVWQMIARNPATAVVRPRVPRRDMQTLSPDQSRRFLSAATQDRLHGLYAVLLGCGLRIGEAMGLTWPDIDLVRGTLTVRQQLCEVAGTLFLQEPKTERARRTVHMPGFVIEAMRAHQTRMHVEGHVITDRLLVFVDTQGNPIRRSNLRRRSFEPLLRKAGLPRIRLHDLRHTAATLHLRENTHPSVVQQMLGHSHVGVTLGTYSHVLPTMQTEAAAKLDALMRKGEGQS